MIIPTHDRAACVEEYLTQTAEAARAFDLDIIIWDTSPNDDTRVAVERQRTRGFANIQYARSPEPADPTGIDRKVVAACVAYCGRYEYLWFSSDGTVIDLPTVLPRLLEALKEGYDLVGLGHIACPPSASVEYTECVSLFRDCGWWLTSLTSEVLSARLLRRGMEVLPLISPSFWGLWLPMSVFHVFAAQPFRMLYLPLNTFWQINPRRNDSFWKVSGNCLWQWGMIWCEAVDALPTVYDSEKAKVLRSYDRHIHLFSLRQLVSMKPEGNLTLEKVWRYRAYLPRVTDTPISWFYFIALFVNSGVVRWMKAVFHWVKRKTGKEKTEEKK